MQKLNRYRNFYQKNKMSINEEIISFGILAGKLWANKHKKIIKNKYTSQLDDFFVSEIGQK